MFCKVMWYCCILIVEVTLNYYNDFEGQLWTRESEIVKVSEKKWDYKTTSIFKIKKNMDNTNISENVSQYKLGQRKLDRRNQ